ncbi:hypothetical protein [Listeria booriae]|uniref:Uncharacterized protein n=1 Tax=Listeria booriae TaxID=1552123 RepID=A0A7X1CGM2_9LIST|nr:hypothetical protein [Listeria booriae]MBC1563624.1 hypothetical protein [Listeria booriae]
MYKYDDYAKQEMKRLERQMKNEDGKLTAHQIEQLEMAHAAVAKEAEKQALKRDSKRLIQQHLSEVEEVLEHKKRLFREIYEDLTHVQHALHGSLEGKTGQQVEQWLKSQVSFGFPISEAYFSELQNSIKTR